MLDNCVNTSNIILHYYMCMYNKYLRDYTVNDKRENGSKERDDSILCMTTNVSRKEITRPKRFHLLILPNIYTRIYVSYIQFPSRYRLGRDISPNNIILMIKSHFLHTCTHTVHSCSLMNVDGKIIKNLLATRVQQFIKIYYIP